MIDVEETGVGLRVVDAAKNELTVQIDDWEPGGRERPIDRRVHETVSGYASEIRFPDSGAVVQSGGSGDLHMLHEEASEALEPDHYLIQIDRALTAFVAVGETAVTCRNSSDSCSLTFPDRTPVTLAFRSFVDLPDETVTVPPTPQGLASALTRMGESPWTESPDRTYPSMRGHPPLLQADEAATVDVPAEGNGARSSTGRVRLRVPASFEPLFVVAPLAYYLGAHVVVEDCTRPSVDTNDRRRALGGDSPLPVETAALLRRVFYLDCLVRNAGPFGVDLRETRLIEETSLEPSEVYGLPMAERVSRYLAVDFDPISDEFPRWPLITYLDPIPSNVSTIPHLLDRFSLIAPPDPRSVDADELIVRSLSDFQRSSASAGQGTWSALGPLVATESDVADTRGWIADGNPIDAFKTPPEAFEHRLSAFERTEGPISITVVLNAPTMELERAEVVDVYRNPASDVESDLTVVDLPSRDELLQLFEGEDDFVHYIGHCDPGGLRCRDGTVSMDEVTESRIQTFFLNACGSYQEGLELVRKGAVSGAVTFGDVIDEQARKVGSTFARMLTIGFDTETALSFARQRAILNRQYAVVGDGTHVLSQCDHPMKVTYHGSRVSGDRFSLHVESHATGQNGAVFSPTAYSDLCLYGNEGEHTIDADQFRQVLEVMDSPIEYEDEFFWPGELLEELP